LQRKEERRKLAALEKQRELQKKDVDIQAGGDNSMNALLALVEDLMNCSSFHV
jgi:hypothetical protein